MTVILVLQTLLSSLDGPQFGMGPLTALAVLAVGTAVVGWLAARGHTRRTHTEPEFRTRRGAMRRRQRRAGVIIATAPDTPGKPRPRAPGHAAMAA